MRDLKIGKNLFAWAKAQPEAKEIIRAIKNKYEGKEYPYVYMSPTEASIGDYFYATLHINSEECINFSVYEGLAEFRPYIEY